MIVVIFALRRYHDRSSHWQKGIGLGAQMRMCASDRI
jgi:hypothetical protein